MNIFSRQNGVFSCERIRCAEAVYTEGSTMTSGSLSSLLGGWQGNGIHRFDTAPWNLGVLTPQRAHGSCAEARNDLKGDITVNAGVFRGGGQPNAIAQPSHGRVTSASRPWSSPTSWCRRFSASARAPRTSG